SGEGVLHRLRDPQSAAGVEVDVDGEDDVRFGGDELDLEAGRQAERFLLLGGLARGRRRDVGGVGVWLGWLLAGCQADTQDQTDTNGEGEAPAHEQSPRVWNAKEGENPV